MPVVCRHIYNTTFVHQFGVRIPYNKNKKTEASSDDVASVLARCKGCFLCFAKSCVLADRCFAAVPVSDFAAENNSQDCFLYAAHPLGVRIPFAENKKTEASSDDVASVLARCKGFEPLTFWFVVGFFLFHELAQSCKKPYFKPFSDG